MGTLKACIAAIFFSILLPLLTAAQESQKPPVASVSASESRTLLPGDHFTVYIHFDRAPRDYRGASVFGSFELVGEPTANFPKSAVDTPTKQSWSEPAQLKDDKADYELNLSVSQAMWPGKWKLAKIVLGRYQQPIPFSGEISFEIPGLPPISAQAHSPGKLEAGQKYTLVVTLVRYPQDLQKGCALAISVSIKEVSPASQTFAEFRQDLVSNRLSYEFSKDVPPDFPGGKFEGEVIAFPYRTDDNRDGCWYPQLIGETRFSFTIEPDRKLVTPTSAAVAVNPAQIELLRAEASRLTATAERLKPRLVSGDDAAIQALLRASVQEALKDLAETEAKYKKLGKYSSTTPDTDIFFEDIRSTYERALKVVSDKSSLSSSADTNIAHGNRLGPEMRPVSSREHTDKIPGRLSLAAETVLAGYEHNAAAFNVVADTGLEVFDLVVMSDPPGAAVSYGRQGDTKFKPLQDPTNSTIRALPYAYWIVQFDEPGYARATRQHEPFTNPNHVITVHLEQEKPKGAK
jgi:hypothetical protein